MERVEWQAQEAESDEEAQRELQETNLAEQCAMEAAYGYEGYEEDRLIMMLYQCMMALVHDAF